MKRLMCALLFLLLSCPLHAQLASSDDVAITVNASPTPNACITTPLLVTVSNWPSTASGSRQFRYTSSQVLVGFVVDMNVTRATFTDARGCTKVVSK